MYATKMGFPDSSVGKESTCNVGDLGSILGLGRSAGERKGYPLQYSGLENSMDFIVHAVTKSWTQLSDFHFHFMQPKAQNEKEEEKGVEKTIWKKMVEILTYLVKSINLQTQEAQQMPKTIMKWVIPRHLTVTLLKAKDKKKISKVAK